MSRVVQRKARGRITIDDNIDGVLVRREWLGRKGSGRSTLGAAIEGGAEVIAAGGAEAKEAAAMTGAGSQKDNDTSEREDRGQDCEEPERDEHQNTAQRSLASAGEGEAGKVNVVIVTDGIAGTDADGATRHSN